MPGTRWHHRQVPESWWPQFQEVPWWRSNDKNMSMFPFFLRWWWWWWWWWWWLVYSIYIYINMNSNTVIIMIYGATLLSWYNHCYWLALPPSFHGSASFHTNSRSPARPLCSSTLKTRRFSGVYPNQKGGTANLSYMEQLGSLTQNNMILVWCSIHLFMPTTQIVCLHQTKV